MTAVKSVTILHSNANLKIYTSIFYTLTFLFISSADIDFYFKNKMASANTTVGAGDLSFPQHLPPFPQAILNASHHHQQQQQQQHQQSFSSQEIQNLQQLKNKLIANNSASKASIYYTPPDENPDFPNSQLNLQTSPIHINYINENLDHRLCFAIENNPAPSHFHQNLKARPPQFLINTPNRLESPTTLSNMMEDNLRMDTTAGLNADTAMQLSQLQITSEHPLGAGGIEDSPATYSKATARELDKCGSNAKKIFEGN